MPSALETLVKILNLERSRNHDNKAVIGGLGSFADTWSAEAHRQAKTDAHHHLVDALADALRAYEQTPFRDERAAALRAMLDQLVGRGELSPLPGAAPATSRPIARGQAASSPFALSNADIAPPRPARPPVVQARPTRPNTPSMFPPAPEPEARRAPRLDRPPRRPRPHAHDSAASADALRGLAAPVTVVKGVGAKLAEALGGMGIRTLEDLLLYLPRRYDDYTRQRTIARLLPDQVVTVIGTVRQVDVRTGQNNRRDTALLLDDGTATMQVVFFGQHFIARQLHKGDQIVVSGTTSLYRERVALFNPEWEPLDSEMLHTTGIVPVYRIAKGVNARRFRTLMRDALDFWADRLPDYVPLPVLDRAELGDLGWTLRHLHFPDSQDHLHHAQRRLAFDELLLMQLAVLGHRRQWQSVPAVPLPVEANALAAFLAAAFPFPFTGAQQRALADIQRDAARAVPMNRLLQGDVGSGKTAVAVATAALALFHGQQAAIMAPTSILAEQHARAFSEAFAHFPHPAGRPARVALLTGALSKAERDAVRVGLQDGSIDLVVGTHALIQEGVSIPRLGVAVIDEQHRFGVEQRGALRNRSTGANPHLLVMTATPIPRTLALTMYADLDLSVLDELPPGRTPTETSVLQDAAMRERAYQFVAAQVGLGRQAFVVYPLVEASATSEARSATEAFTQLTQVFHNHRVGLLHGRMKPLEKDHAMRAFAEGAYDVLVTTSVAEVGVNVPNASVMLIEGANRFGLSQLHQFRGRVGRGKHPGYCLLIPDTHTPEALARLQALADTNDGFRLAEEDWRQRGAGDLLGMRQSGHGTLRLMDTMDPLLVALAQREARTLYEEDPSLAAPEHSLLRQRVQMQQDARSDIS